jgi:glycosyltransferase involved in cell wall biosynthesis
LLQSISIQNFKDFELVITDDSGDDSVSAVIAEFPDLPVSYHRNEIALGTPANWNFGISLAKGEWIKIMHDDDWFADENSLSVFADSTKSGEKFIVSRYADILEKGGIEKPVFPARWKKKIIRNPLNLLARNVIGPPSVTLIHSSIKEQYDERMKWRVDMDFYIRLLKKLGSFHLIEQALINVGISSNQVTNSCINMPEVELPEGLLMLEKYGTKPLQDVLVYDAWWRILRNTGVRSRDDLLKFAKKEDEWPEIIFRMQKDQSRLSSSMLNRGVVSKAAMMSSYLNNRNLI